ncbi:large ribosomal subunit protein bL28m-like [Crassostrea virginica]
MMSASRQASYVLRNNRVKNMKLPRTKNAAYSYSWNDEVNEMLPEHYKERCLEFMRREPTPIHYIPSEGTFGIHKLTNLPNKIQNIPVPVLYPKEANDGLWGGEGFVLGYKMDKGHLRMKNRIPKIWKPFISKRAVYSEILDQWYEIPMTMRVLDLIDECHGFDYYILKTHERDLNSLLAMKLRREMLLALANKTCYPDNKEKQEKMIHKYHEFIIPAEEAEWVGLTVSQALNKAFKFRKAQPENQTKPLKEIFEEQLVLKLHLKKENQWEQIMEESDKEPQRESPPPSLMQKLNPFSDYNRNKKK